MTGRIFDIKRMAVHDGDGIRTTVFLKGCPLKCKWCHNPEGLFTAPILSYTVHSCINCGECAKICHCHKIIDGKHAFDRTKCINCGKCTEICLGNALRLYGQDIEAEALLPLLLEDRLFYEQTGGGVTLSGGECLLQPDFCAEILEMLKNENISTAIDTCGFVSQTAIDKILPYTDKFLYDLKAYNENVHIACTGQSNKVILDNLYYIDSKNKKIEVRIPLVPNMNDSELEKILLLLKRLNNITSVKILPYHNHGMGKYEAMGMKYEIPEIENPSAALITNAEKTVERIFYGEF